jgi:hypothetical protein
MWMFWLFTVLLGGLATAVLLFTSTYRYYDLYEAMHDNFVTYFVQALPVVWIIAFITLMYVASRGLRATRRGYRLSPWVVGGSSVGLSVFLGIGASQLGFGHLVDTTLGDVAPMYNSMVQREEKLWMQPGEGRLVGRMVQDTEYESAMVAFMDVTGQAWQVDMMELRSFDRGLLNSGQRVRVLGTELESDGQPSRFHACGVFPWMIDKNRPLKELSQERKHSIERMYGHTDNQLGGLDRLEEQAFGTASATNTPSVKICADIAAVRRISENMR